MAIIPAAHKIDLKKLGEILNRTFKFSRETDVFAMFQDCKNGAVPAVGAAYNLETVIDDSLLHEEDLYFEGGDHEDLLHLNIDQFKALVEGSDHGDFCMNSESEAKIVH